MVVYQYRSSRVGFIFESVILFFLGIYHNFIFLDLSQSYFFGFITILFFYIQLLTFIEVTSQFSHSVVSDSLQPHGLQHARLPCPSSTPQSLLKLMSIESVMASNHLILCHPLLLLPSVFPSIRVFSNESVLRIRWPNFLSFRFSINPFNEYSRLISFRVEWLNLLAVQGTLKSLF